MTTSGKTIHYNEPDCYSKYKALDELTKLMSFGKETDLQGRQYEKMIQTGDFGMCDYGKGFLCVKLFLCMNHSAPKNDLGFTEFFYIKVTFVTWDDGDCDGFSVSLPKKEAQERLDNIAKHVFSDMVILPTQERLNELLREYGVYVN
jgi:hypothetical protein